MLGQCSLAIIVPVAAYASCIGVGYNYSYPWYRDAIAFHYSIASFHGMTERDRERESALFDSGVRPKKRVAWVQIDAQTREKRANRADPNPSVVSFTVLSRPLLLLLLLLLLVLRHSQRCRIFFIFVCSHSLPALLHNLLKISFPSTNLGRPNAPIWTSFARFYTDIMKNSIYSKIN